MWDGTHAQRCTTVRRYLGNKEIVLPCSGGAYMAFSGAKMAIAINIQNDPTTVRRLVVHECCHCVFEIMRTRSVKYSCANAEVFCYTLDSLVSMVFKEMGL